MNEKKIKNEIIFCRLAFFCEIRAASSNELKKLPSGEG